MRTLVKNWGVSYLWLETFLFSPDTAELALLTPLVTSSTKGYSFPDSSTWDISSSLGVLSLVIWALATLAGRFAGLSLQFRIMCPFLPQRRHRPCSLRRSSSSYETQLAVFILVGSHSIALLPSITSVSMCFVCHILLVLLVCGLYHPLNACSWALIQRRSSLKL